MSFAVIGFRESFDLLKYADLWLKSNGGIYIDVGLYDGDSGLKGSDELYDDIYLLGSPDEKITMRDLLKMFKYIEKRANYMSQFRTCYYEGVFQVQNLRKNMMTDKKGKEIMPKYRLAWGT